MSAALTLAEQGFPVHLVEVHPELGGNLRHVYTSTSDIQPQTILRETIQRIEAHPYITLHLDSQVVDSAGFKGNFISTIQNKNGARSRLQHGATILATGGQEYRGSEYGYGTHDGILTQMEFEERYFSNPQILPPTPKSVIMIQCVGPAERYCSRICCTVAIKNALALKRSHPDTEVTILYKDIRTYGFKEKLYTQAREAGVIFLRYTGDTQPKVEVRGQGRSDSKIQVTTREPNLGRTFTFNPDLVVLSMPVVPNSNMHELVHLFKVPLDADGFLQEAHVKLRPVDFATDGIFMAGMAHYPKLVDESIIQGQAAAARAARILSQEAIKAGGSVAVVDPTLCTGCLTCVRVCPFGVPVIDPDLVGIGDICGAAYIESAVCQGCGSCAAECPAHAIQLLHYSDAQMSAKAIALVRPDLCVD
jgi:heterodisulfide reductase subunit A-like polyferredoxin